MTRWAMTLGGITLLALAAGCPPRTPMVMVEPVERELADVLDTVNRNAAKLDRALWCNGVHVTARIPDDGREHVYNLEGSLLFRAPRDLRIDLRPALGETVMGIGSNQDDYWVWIEPELHLMRWGRHRFAGRPCVEKMPVQPDQLAALLGLATLPEPHTDFLGPVRKTQPDHEVLAYLRRAAHQDTWRLDREYLIDRRPPFMLREVLLYDDRGRPIVRARLDDHRQPWPDGPWIARRVLVEWPRDGGRFTLHAASCEGRTAVHPRAFARPTTADLPAGVRDIVQVDAACEGAPIAPVN